MSDGLKGWPRLKRATSVSIRALLWAFRNEDALRLEGLALLVFAPLAIWLGESGVEHALLIGSLLLVLIVEILNTAIEAAIDRIGPEWHELSGRAKDLGSVAVMLALLNAAVIWSFILWKL